MFRTSAIVLTFLLFAILGIRADDKKDITVKEVDLKALKREFPKSGFGKPTEITSEDELKKAIPEEDVQAKLKKEIDFGKQKLLFFAWSGSGQDKLTYEVGKEGVIFKHVPGLTLDLASHFHAFIVPKDTNWKIGDK